MWAGEAYDGGDGFEIGRHCATASFRWSFIVVYLAVLEEQDPFGVPTGSLWVAGQEKPRA